MPADRTSRSRFSREYDAGYTQYSGYRLSAAFNLNVHRQPGSESLDRESFQPERRSTRNPIHAQRKRPRLPTETYLRFERTGSQPILEPDEDDSIRDGVTSGVGRRRPTIAQVLERYQDLIHEITDFYCTPARKAPHLLKRELHVLRSKLESKLLALDEGREDETDHRRLHPDYERVVVVVAMAKLNPVVVPDYDAIRIAPHVRTTRVGSLASQAKKDLKKRTTQYPIGRQEKPCVVLDGFGIVLQYHLPGITARKGIVEYNAATEILNPLLEKNFETAKAEAEKKAKAEARANMKKQSSELSADRDSSDAVSISGHRQSTRIHAAKLKTGSSAKSSDAMSARDAPGITSAVTLDAINCGSVLEVDENANSATEIVQMNKWRTSFANFSLDFDKIKPGLATLSPATQMTGHKGLDDKIYASADYQTKLAKIWQKKTAHLEDIASALLSLIAPLQYKNSLRAMERIREGGYVDANKEPVSILLGSRDKVPHAKEWCLPFTGIQIISNRVTPPHRDPQGNYATGDLLTSLGSHTGARFSVEDFGGSFSYDPGTFEFICGKLLEHSCGPWDDGDRVCYARYTHDRIHECVGIPAPPWISFESATEGMSSAFRLRYLKDLGLALDSQC